MQQGRRRIAVVAPSTATDAGALRHVIVVVEIPMPDQRAAVAGVPAMQIAIGAQRVQESRGWIKLGRRGWPGVQSLVARGVTPVLWRGVADSPHAFA